MARLLPVAYVVAGALLLMGVIVIWADLVKPDLASADRSRAAPT